MKRSIFLFAAVLVFGALPDATHAQTRSDGGWWEWAARSDRASGTVRPDAPRRDRDGDWDDDDGGGDDRWDDDDDDRWDDDDDRWEDRRRDQRRARGPQFCRNGQGHPTKGMRWCYEKGFATPQIDRRIDRRSRTPRWERRTIEDIIFGTPRRDQDRRRTTMDRGVLGEILGVRAVRDLERVASGPIVGRWVYPSRTVRVLQLRDGRGPLAEMTDYDGDRRVDLVLVNSLR